ncbi:MAG: lactate utilization protein [Rhodospirillales bacterium]
MSARDAILGKVRQRLSGREGRGDAAVVEARIGAHARNLMPARGQVGPAERLALFQAKAQELSATTDRLADADAIPAAVASYLRSQNLPLEIRRAPDPGLAALPWGEEPLLKVKEGRAQGDDAVSLTPVEAAVAETGTLVLTSGPETPTSLNFLPETHIAVLRTSQLVGTYEEVFERLRARFGPGVMPRTLNFVTGPSRTGDIEQKIELGAHGPRRLHILLVEDAAPEPASA